MSNSPMDDSARDGRGHEELVDSRTGWMIVLVSSVVLFFVWGTMFTFSVYADALGTAFGLTGIQTSTAYSIQLFVFFLASGFVGIFVSRFRLRPVLMAAAVAAAVGIGLVQVSASFMVLVAAMSFVGGASGATFVIVISLIPQWFDTYQGRAMGAAVVGNGLGVQLLPYAWISLLNVRDVRFAYLTIGGGLVCVLVVAAFAFRRPPIQTADEKFEHGASRAWIQNLVTDRRFRFAIVGVPVVWAWYHVLSAQLVDILIVAGLARSTATMAFGFMGGVSIISRVASGTLADVVGLRRTLVASVLITAVGLLLVTGGPTPALLSIVTFGVGLGGVATLYSPALVRAFGPENATAVNGVFQLSLGISGLLAPVGMNLFVSFAGGYQIPLLVLAVVTAVGAGLFWLGTTPANE